MSDHRRLGNRVVNLSRYVFGTSHKEGVLLVNGRTKLSKYNLCVRLCVYGLFFTYIVCVCVCVCVL